MQSKLSSLDKFCWYLVRDSSPTFHLLTILCHHFYTMKYKCSSEVPLWINLRQWTNLNLFTSLILHIACILNFQTLVPDMTPMNLLLNPWIVCKVLLYELLTTEHVDIFWRQNAILVNSYTDKVEASTLTIDFTAEKICLSFYFAHIKKKLSQKDAKLKTRFRYFIW